MLFHRNIQRMRLCNLTISFVLSFIYCFSFLFQLPPPSCWTKLFVNFLLYCVLILNWKSIQLLWYQPHQAFLTLRKLLFFPYFLLSLSSSKKSKLYYSSAFMICLFLFFYYIKHEHSTNIHFHIMPHLKPISFTWCSIIFLFYRKKIF